MNIGVLSGKGGTGKTLISTNLALEMNATYVDCDVEEPNGFIFLKPEEIKTRDVLVDNPLIDEEKCILCGKCVDVCEFNALAKTKKIFLFEKLCHSCGGCELVCPTQALTYGRRRIGSLDQGVSRQIKCVRGILDIGEAMAVPLIGKVLDSLDKKELNIIDCAPGTSCNVVTSLEQLDLAVLVTEPTEFGLHDFKRAIDLCKMFNLDFGVVINRVTEEENIISRYCKEEDINVLLSLPFDKDVARIYSRGDLLVDDEKYKNIFTELADKIGDLK